MTTNYDPKPGRWMLPLVVLAMVAFTYLFVRELPSAASAEENGDGTTETTGAVTTTTAADGTATTTTTAIEVDEATMAYLDTLPGFQTRLTDLQTQLGAANGGWDADPRTISYDQAQESFVAVAEGTAGLVAEIQAVTPPEALADAHNSVVAAAQQAADAASRALAGLRAPAPDTGEGRRTAVNDFDVAVAAFADAVAAVGTAATGG
ncbi:MAG TPA: hypothetical protein VLA54_11505 [Acidimicrobiia bacterium]|nr:hypothetical protein [Acidimicrobiia bacterium]